MPRILAYQRVLDSIDHKDHPDVVAVLQKMNLTNDMQAGMIYKIDVEKRDLDEVVDEWMSANESVWRQWLP